MRIPFGRRRPSNDERADDAERSSESPEMASDIRRLVESVDQTDRADEYEAPPFLSRADRATSRAHEPDGVVFIVSYRNQVTRSPSKDSRLISKLETSLRSCWPRVFARPTSRSTRHLGFPLTSGKLHPLASEGLSRDRSSVRNRRPTCHEQGYKLCPKSILSPRSEP